ncbi:unnamed protein product, partial [marine sediment metagenome]
IATGLGIPLGPAAGAIVAGAYFGDKMSPFSDVANLAPVTAGSNLFDHIKHMLWSATPAWLIGLFIYFIVGLKYGGRKIRGIKAMTMPGSLCFLISFFASFSIFLSFYLKLNLRFALALYNFKKKFLLR